MKYLRALLLSIPGIFKDKRFPVLLLTELKPDGIRSYQIIYFHIPAFILRYGETGVSLADCELGYGH